MHPGPIPGARPRRNDLCACGSGRRYKHCCGLLSAIAVGRTAPTDEARFDEIRALCDAGNFAVATRRALEHVNLHPQDPAGLTELGVVHMRAGRPGEGVGYLRRAVQLAPDSADCRYNLAQAFEYLGQDDAALAELRAAVALGGGDPAAAVGRLANLLWKRDRIDEAIDCCRRVASLQPDSLSGRMCHAQVMIAEHRRAEAGSYMEETTARFPASAEAKRGLAMFLREEGRFDEAVALLVAATRGSPAEAANACHDWAMSKRIGVTDMPVLQQMREMLARDTLPASGRSRLHFGLGKALDDLGAYQDAMRHFDEANRIVRRDQPFDSGSFISAVRHVTGVFSADTLNIRAHLGSPSEVPLLILGMPRSGTTLVEQIVSSHHDVAAGGELCYWSNKAGELAHVRRDRLSASIRHISGMVKEYEAVLHRVAPDAMRVTDKTTGNFLWAGLIHLLFPKARIIHCRRDPVDTCLSNYFTGFGQQNLFAYGKADLVLYYRHYANLMRHWRSVLSPDIFHEVDYERLIESPESVTRRLIDFCGLDWDDACLRPEANRRPVRTASAWQVRQPIFHGSIDRWRHYEPWLEELAQLLEPETVKPADQ